MKKSSKLLDFLFGKDTDIFNKKGHVEHKLPQDWWDHWEDRFKEPEFLWQNHKGFNPQDRPLKNKEIRK